LFTPAGDYLDLASYAQIAYSGYMKRPPMTVVETHRFLGDAEGVFSNGEQRIWWPM
jgi:hypothetical protein